MRYAATVPCAGLRAGRGRAYQPVTGPGQSPVRGPGRVRPMIVMSWSSPGRRRRTRTGGGRRSRRCAGCREDVGGMTSFVVADDAGLTGGNADTVPIADFADAEAFARYAQDPVHLAGRRARARGSPVAARCSTRFDRPIARNVHSGTPHEGSSDPGVGSGADRFRHGCARSTAPAGYRHVLGRPSQPVGVRIRDVGEIAAALPHLLGFRPQESVVLIGLGGANGRRVGLTVRGDIPPPGTIGRWRACCPGAWPPTTPGRSAGPRRLRGGRRDLRGGARSPSPRPSSGRCRASPACRPGRRRRARPRRPVVVLRLSDPAVPRRRHALPAGVTSSRSRRSRPGPSWRAPVRSLVARLAGPIGRDRGVMAAACARVAVEWPRPSWTPV